MTTLDQDSLRDFLIDLRDHFEHYHERKENMSWLATTAYLASITALASVIFSNDRMEIDLYSRLAFAMIILLTWCFVLLFVHKQFADRGIAANVVVCKLSFATN